MTTLPLPSRGPSGDQLNGDSRQPSRLGAKPRSSSNRPDSSPGLSTSQANLDLELVRPVQPTGSGLPTERDWSILQALDQYRYLDRSQIQALFFEGPRSCQYRLRWLHDLGLVNAWRVTVRPNHGCRPSIYLLSRRGAAALADWLGSDAGPYLRRAEHAIERHFHLVHQLEANQFFVDLALATRDRDDLGLYNWVGEHGVKSAYAEGEERGPIPDGWGRLLTPDREVLLHLEWDRGTEQPRRLRLKLEAYRAYFVARPQASCNQVLLVAPGDQRERLIRDVVKAVAARDRECCQFWTTTATRLRAAGSLGAAWWGPDRPQGTLVSSMPGLARSARRIEDSIAKPAWWERRSGGGPGA
jgi:Replication-relaxation